MAGGALVPLSGPSGIVPLTRLPAKPQGLGRDRALRNFADRSARTRTPGRGMGRAPASALDQEAGRRGCGSGALLRQRYTTRRLFCSVDALYLSGTEYPVDNSSLAEKLILLQGLPITAECCDIADCMRR